MLFPCSCHQCLRDVLTYIYLHIDIYKGKQWQQALGLFPLMQRTSVPPDVISFSAVISAGEKGQQLQQALGLLTVRQQTSVLPEVFLSCHQHS